MTEVTSQVLYDRGLDVYHWPYYDGSVPSDSAALTAASWGWLYTQAGTSFLGGYDPLPPSSGYMSYMTGSPAGDTLHIASMWLDYHYIRPDALDLNLLYIHPVDSTLHDVPGRPQSPYTRDTVFMVVPLNSFVHQGVVQLLFRSDFQMGNLGTPDSIAVDMGSGWQAVTLDVPLSFSLYGSGDKVFSIRFTDSLGRHWYAKSKVEVRPGAPLAMGGGTGYSEEPDFIYTGISGIKSLDVFYGNDCGKLLKPFVFIEGFNPDQLNPFDYGEMQRRINRPSYENNPILTPTSNTMWEDLYDSGYDVVYVDFEDGAGDVLLNGNAVRAAIEWINAQKALNGSTEKNLVMGASMGGLCGYWALGSMEADNVDHETEKYFTFDSPLRGANIPIGLQHFFKAMGETVVPQGAFGLTTLEEKIPYLAVAKQVLNAPAPKQMLLVHAWNASSGLSTWSQSFLSTLHSVSIDEAEVIYISNGSGIGEGQMMDCNLEIMKLEDITQYGNKPWHGSFKIREVNVYPSRNYDSNALLVEYKYRIRALLSYEWWNIKIKGYNGPALDCGPGGVTDFGIGQIIGQALNGDVDINSAFPQVNKAAFCFIPTPSSQNIATIYDYNMTFPSLGCTNTMASGCIQSRSNNYILPYNNLPAHNQNHAVLTSELATYILNKYYQPEIPALIDDHTFNLGRSDNSGPPNPSVLEFEQTNNVINRNITIEDQGRLHINMSGRIARTDIPANPLNENDQTLNVSLSKGCNSTVVLVRDGGKIIVGEDGGSWGLNIGNLHIGPQTALIVDDGGEVHIDKSSKIIVSEEGVLEVRAGSFVEARWGGGVVVEEGGEMIVREGGKLRLSHANSTVEIKSGGKLIIEDGAVIQLWDGTHTEGEARIIVRGRLEYGSDVDLSGNGFFDFYSGHILSLPSGRLEMEGYNKQTRLIRLNSTLNIGSSDLDIKNARIDFRNYGTSLKTGYDSRVTLDLVHLNAIGSDCYGLMSDQYRRVDIRDTDVTGFNLGIGLASPSSSTLLHTRISGCSFENNDVGVELGYMDEAYISGCTFTGMGLGDIGVLSAMVGQLVVFQSEFTGFDNALFFVEAKNNVSISASIIQNNNYGITTFSNTDELNIAVRNGTVIRDNEVGIRIHEGFIKEIGPDYGLVLFDCGKLINNKIGIQGKDILLQIDAYTNSSPIPSLTRSNSFICNMPGNQLLFDICYETRSVSSNSILARGNYWNFGTIMPVGSPWYIRQQNSMTGPFCSNAPNILTPFNRLGELSVEPEECPTGVIIEDRSGEGGECLYNVGDYSIDILEKYGEFYGMWTQAIDDEVYDPEGEWYSILEELMVIDPSDEELDSLCAHLVSVSHNFRKDIDFTRSAESEGTERSGKEKLSEISIYPNPVDRELYFTLSRGDWEIIITHISGIEVMRFRAWGGDGVMDCSMLSSGMYILKGIESQKEEKILKFIKR